MDHDQQQTNENKTGNDVARELYELAMNRDCGFRSSAKRTPNKPDGELGELPTF